MINPKSNISIIVAMAEDGAIGDAGDLLWHISDDLRRFKRLTSGHTVVMGRRTFESLPKGALPDRRNIVVSRNPEFSAPGAETFRSLEDAIEACSGDDEVFIIGGAQIYKGSFGLASRLYLTKVSGRWPDADTRLAIPDIEEWVVTDEEEPLTDPKSGLQYQFVNYRRK